MNLNLMESGKTPDDEEDDDDCFNLEGKLNPNKVVLSPLSKLRLNELSITVVDKHKRLDERNLDVENDFNNRDSSESNSSILQSFFQMSFFSSAIPDITDTTFKSTREEQVQYGLSINNSNTKPQEVISRSLPTISADKELFGTEQPFESFGTEQPFEFADVYGKKDQSSLSKMVNLDGGISGDNSEPLPCKDCGARPVWTVSYNRWSITDQRCDACNLISNEEELLSSSRQANHDQSLQYIDGEEIIFDRAEYKGNVWDKQWTHSWFVAHSKNGPTDDKQYSDRSVLRKMEDNDNPLNSEVDSIEITDIYKSNGEDVPTPSFSSSRAIFNRAGGVRSKFERLGNSSPAADGPIVGLKTSPNAFQRSTDVIHDFAMSDNSDHQLMEYNEEYQETFPLISSQDSPFPRRATHRVPLEIEITTPANRFSVEHGNAFIDEDSAEDYYSQPFFCYLLCGLFS